MRRAIDTLTSRPAVVFALLAQVTLSTFLLVTSITLPASERAILDQGVLDARWLFLAAALAGYVYALRYRSDTIVLVWVALLTLTCFGRALDILFTGSEFLPRAIEFRVALGWLVVWMMGVVVGLLLTAHAAILRFREAAGRDDV